MSDYTATATAPTSAAQSDYVAARRRSPTVGFWLAFLFGPLGSLYAGRAGLVFAILGFLLVIGTAGFGLIIMWPWSWFAVPAQVHRYNRLIETEAALIGASVRS